MRYLFHKLLPIFIIAIAISGLSIYLGATGKIPFTIYLIVTTLGVLIFPDGNTNPLRIIYSMYIERFKTSPEKRALVATNTREIRQHHWFLLVMLAFIILTLLLVYGVNFWISTLSTLVVILPYTYFILNKHHQSRKEPSTKIEIGEYSPTKKQTISSEQNNTP